MKIYKQIRYWYKKYTPNFLQKFFKALKPNWVDLFFHKINSYFYDEESGHGEYKKILEVTELLNIEQKFYLDIGASDGLSSSCTFPFAKSDHWKGLSIEYDEKKYNKMKFLYKNFKSASVLKSKITPNNIEEVLDENKIPKNLTFLNIDIDSYDLEVVSVLLNSGYKPEIISMEINEKIPPPIYFSVFYDDDHFWIGDHFYGCSITAANSLLSSFNYGIYELIYNNILFLNKSSFKKLSFQNVTDAYAKGYVDKPDRKKLFSYNEDVDCLQEMKKNEAINFLNEYFKKYEGKYDMKIIEE